MNYYEACKILFIACLVCVCSFAFAKKLSDPPAGQGTSTVGTGGDYASLAEAAADFVGLAGGLTGNWTVEILNDLTEPNNIPFGNATNGYTITIKPATGVTATVTFTQTTDPTVSGHFVIGVTSLTNLDAVAPTHNVIIDGSNSGGTTKDLTFQNSNASIANARVIRVFGNSDNVVIKNCIIKNRSTASSATYAVDYTTRQTAGGPSIPDNGLIDNCTIESISAGAAQGIQFGVSGTIPAGNAQTGMTVQNCIITARSRGIFLNQNAGAIIRNNIIRINQISGGFSSVGIFHNSSNGTTGWTMEIYNNILDQLATANTTAGNYGITAMELSGGAASPNVGTYKVYNNMICGFSYPSGSAVDQLYRGIRTGSASVYLDIYNNSIYMPHFDVVSGATAGNAGAIILVSASNTLACNVKNNMICIKQANGIGILKGTNTGFSSDYNNVYASSSTIFGRLGSTNYNTLSDWQSGTGQDANSTDKDPTVAQPPYSGKWVSGTNLHFDAQPGPIPGWATGIPISGITFDIDGDTRGTNYPMKGCDDSPSLPVTLDMVVVE